MNQTLQLRYTHADHTRVLRDVRKNRLAEADYAQIYYLGFRISAEGKEHYHHALVLADDYDAFLDGVAGEFNTIRDQSSMPSFNGIALVFVRNLMMQDPEMVDSTNHQSITSDIQEKLSTRNDDQYLVFGMVGGHKICLIELYNCDALLAIHRARTMIMEQHHEEFKPLEVCQAHPVTAECYALFDAAAGRIKSLVDGVTTRSVSLH